MKKKIDKVQNKKIKLERAGKQTKWAPVWAVLKKHGKGKRVHPSSMTRHRRNWRRTKLKVRPRKIRRSHFA